MFWGRDAATWAALAGWATVAVYLALGAFAWRQLKEARRLREEQSRPFVVVDIPPGSLLYVTIENIGRTVARNVTFKFTPPLTSTSPKPWAVTDAPLLRDGAPMVPPGRVHRVFLDGSPARYASDLPTVYEAEVRYFGPGGRRRTAYVDKYPIDLRTYIQTSLPDKGLSDLVREVEGLRQDVQRARRHRQ